MTPALDDRLRDHYEDRTRHLPSTGPGLEATVVHDLTEGPTGHNGSTFGFRTSMLAAAGLVIALGFAVLSQQSGQPIGNGALPGTSEPGASASVGDSTVPEATGECGSSPTRTRCHRCVRDLEVTIIPTRPSKGAKEAGRRRAARG